jgi:hypothetical protein
VLVGGKVVVLVLVEVEVLVLVEVEVLVVDVEVEVELVDVEVLVDVLVAQHGTNVPLPIIVELPAGNIKEPTKASIVTEVPKLTTSVVHTQTPVGTY